MWMTESDPDSHTVYARSNRSDPPACQLHDKGSFLPVHAPVPSPLEKMPETDSAAYRQPPVVLTFRHEPSLHLSSNRW